MNNGASRHWRGNRQRGAALVEMAIVVSLFLVLIFGIIEFARAIFEWSRLVEATRAGARYAIVNDPACSIYETTNDPKYKCEGGTTGDPLDCDDDDEDEKFFVEDGNCPVGDELSDAGCRIVERMRRIQPLINTQGAKVTITYACTDAGFAGLAQKVPAVTVKTEDVKYSFIATGLLGIHDLDDDPDDDKWSITMPAFATTRTGEDMHTVTAPTP